jgi:hypothetical protein
MVEAPMIILFSGVCWILVWIFVLGRAAAVRDDDALVKLFAKALPAFSAASFLLFYAAVPRRGPVFGIVVWMHHAAFIALFAFLSVAQCLITQAWWQVRLALETNSIAATYRRVWILTELVPAPIAIAVFLTGMRLIWESPADSPASTWLLILICSFSLFFFDGLLGYSTIIRKTHHHWQSCARDKIPAPQAAHASLSTADYLQLTVHFISWPLLLAVGIRRWNWPNPISDRLVEVEHRLSRLPEGWSRVVVALILWLIPGALVVLVRFIFSASCPEKYRATD